MSIREYVEHVHRIVIWLASIKINTNISDIPEAPFKFFRISGNIAILWKHICFLFRKFYKAAKNSIIAFVGSTFLTNPIMADRLNQFPNVPCIISQENFGSIFRDPHFEDCHNVKCEAIRDIAEAKWIMNERDIPNSLAKLHPTPGNWRFVRNRNLTKLFTRHLERMQIYCKILIGISRGVLEWSDRYNVVYTNIEIGTRIAKSGSSCLPEIISALPRISDVNDALVEAREECVANKRAACTDIQRK